MHTILTPALRPYYHQGSVSAPPAWTPTAITGCVCWLPPLASVMSTENTTPITPPSVDGDPVGRWEDQTGTGNHATQSSIGSLRPGYYTSIQNGLPMLLFDGSTDYLAANGLAQYFDGEDAAATLALVIKKVTNTGAQTLLGCGRSTTTTPQMSFQTNGATNYRVRKFDDAASAANPTGGTPDTSPHLLLFRINGTTVDTWLDSTQIMTAAALNVGVLTLDRVGIGCLVNTGTGSFANTYIGEIILWDNAISNGDATTVRTELIAKWGL